MQCTAEIQIKEIISRMRVKNLAELEKILAQKRNAPPCQKTIVAKAQSDGQTIQQPSTPQMRILGLDVALRCTGWGIIDTRTNPFKQTAVDCGVIKNNDRQAISDCLRHLTIGTRELIGLYKPDIAVLEGGFYCQNVHTAISLGAARGAVIAMLAEAGIPIYEYAPRKVKQAICGFGNASKPQVALLVSQVLHIQVDKISNDSTDALALALTHAQIMSVANGLNAPSPI